MTDPQQIIQQLETLRDYIRWAVSEFTRAGVYYGHGTDNALDEALTLVLHTISLPPGSEQQLFDARLTIDERLAVIDKVQQRAQQRIPVPYLTGEAWFAGLSFAVDSRVLIPRSPIAELIEQGFQPWLGLGPVERILDLCSGGGCIGIACAHYFEEAQVDLLDLSADALQVAQDNINRYELQHRITAIESDLFQALPVPELGKGYRLIVSNPPYVDGDDLASMPEEYRYEPALALGSGPDGLELTHQILARAGDYLSDDGLLVVEVGNSGIALEQAYPQIPFTWIEFEHGGHGVFAISRQQLVEYGLLS